MQNVTHAMKENADQLMAVGLRLASFMWDEGIHPDIPYMYKYVLFNVEKFFGTNKSVQSIISWNFPTDYRLHSNWNLRQTEMCQFII